MGKVWHGTILLLGLIGIGTVVWIARRVGTQIHVADAVVSHTLCAGAFISGVDPTQLYMDAILSDRGLAKLERRRRYVIDRALRTVEVTRAGHFREVAAFRDDLGCVVIHDQRFMPQPGSATQGSRAKPDASNMRNDLPVAAPTPAIEAALTDALRSHPTALIAGRRRSSSSMTEGSLANDTLPGTTPIRRSWAIPCPSRSSAL